MNKPLEPVIRNLTNADLTAADIILASAFGGTSDRKNELERYLAIQPDGWLLALLRDQPVGLVGAVNYSTLAYLGLMAVAPEVRRRGIGHALMKELLNRLDAIGCPETLLDATDVGQPLYEKFGFLPEGETSVFIRSELKPAPFEGKKIEPLKPADIQELVAFDKPIFGGSRERVFKALIKDFPGRGFLSRDNSGSITGFVFGQASKIGPWVAANSEFAEALLRAALSLRYDFDPRVTAPSVNKHVRDLLLRHGFKAQRSCTHMRRGGLNPPGQRGLIYGQTSYAIG